MSSETKEKMVDFLELGGFGETLLFDEPAYEEAFIGVTDDGRAVYAYDLMVDCLIADGMTEEEAVEFIDFNIIGFQQANGPIVVYRMPR